jgi:hypothetical protein
MKLAVKYKTPVKKTRGTTRKFLQLCVQSQQHVLEVIPNIKIWYEFEGKQHVYFADFLVRNNDGSSFLCEIKSSPFVSHPRNVAKFSAAEKALSELRVDKFVVLTEQELWEV